MLKMFDIMSNVPYIPSMSSEEKRTWIMGVVTVVAYAAYVAIVLGRADGMPLPEVPYVATLLRTVLGAIVATIVLNIAVAIAEPKGAATTDQRDRQIYRFGEYVGQVFVVIGAVMALALAMAELAHFWIANLLYLSLVLSAALGSLTKIVAYRRGFHPW